ncbi:MAG TPA: shikimate dehydrogenase [Candidatus Limnocylindrales bacterium]|nr:shikimate dehydrogenase [Candidatus Limnocylindrales bacterium]
MGDISGSTKIVGIFGDPIHHTLSPQMHNAAFQALKLEYVYLPFRVTPENLSTAIRSLPSLGILGVNITIPHKERILDYLDELDPEAQVIGAVNTVVVQGQTLKGYNTDGKGFIESLRVENVEPKGKKILLLGAGGAARAVGMQLALEGVSAIFISNRTSEKAERLARDIQDRTSLAQVQVLEFNPRTLKPYLNQVDIIVQTTSVGMSPPGVSPVDIIGVSEKQTVCDLIYKPPKTKFLEMAESQGAKIINGLGMLVYQGALAFQLWTQIPPPIEVMKAALLKSSKNPLSSPVI